MISKCFAFEDLEKKLLCLKSDTLIIFDIDDVLVVANDAIFHPYNRKNALKEQCFKMMLEQFPVTQDRNSGFCKLLSDVFLNGERKLVDPHFPDLIKKLQNKNVNLLGLTKCEVGLFGKIEHLENWKLEELKKHNIDFHSNFFKMADFFLDNIRSTGAKYPLFKKGIIFADQYSKGETFLAFLKKINWKPNAVIFIDDLLGNLTNVQQACKSIQIPFEGIHCLIAHHQTRILDKKIASKQINHLITTGEWICDTETSSLKD